MFHSEKKNVIALLAQSVRAILLHIPEKATFFQKAKK